jgi:uncharacterized membrane protein YcfT
MDKNDLQISIPWRNLCFSSGSQYSNILYKLLSTITVISVNFQILHIWFFIVIVNQFQITKQCCVLITLTGLFSYLHDRVRKFETRFKEHVAPFKNNNNYSNLAQNVINNGHTIGSIEI